MNKFTFRKILLRIQKMRYGGWYRKKYCSRSHGYVRFDRCEISWSIYDWAIPFSIDFSSDLMVFIRVFCVGLVISTNGNRL